ncbi:MAG: GAF domain-containing protein, partial [Tepidisphaeraceae bacterium]
MTVGISGSMTSAPSHLLDLITGAAMGLLRMSRCTVALVSESGQEVEIVSSNGWAPSLAGQRFALTQTPLTRQVLDSGKPTAIADLQRNVQVPLNCEIADRLGVRASLLIPLVIGGRAIGVVTLCHHEPKEFTDADLRLADLLGAQAAVAVANARLWEEKDRALRAVTRLSEQREALYALNTAIYESSDLRVALQKIADTAPAVFGLDFCSLALTTENEDELELAASTAPNDGQVVGTRFNIKGDAASEVFHTRHPLVMDDARNDPRLHAGWKTLGVVGSLAYLPMFRGDGRPLGILSIVRHAAGGFSVEQMNLAQFLATRAALAIENARLHSETRGALEVQKELLCQREALFAVNAAVYQAGTLEESLGKIVELAPRALGVDACMVDLVTETPGEML